MSNSAVFLTLAGMFLVTYLPRVVPALFLRSRKLPPFVEAWLKYVPVAVLSALLIPSLLVSNGTLNLQWHNWYLWAAIPAGVVAWKTRSMFATILVGMGLVALARLIFA